MHDTSSKSLGGRTHNSHRIFCRKYGSSQIALTSGRCRCSQVRHLRINVLASCVTAGFGGNTTSVAFRITCRDAQRKKITGSRRWTTGADLQDAPCRTGASPGTGHPRTDGGHRASDKTKRPQTRHPPAKKTHEMKSGIQFILLPRSSPSMNGVTLTLLEMRGGVGPR